MWIFDKILDAYDKSLDEWRITLFNAIDKWLAWNSKVKNFLPDHATYDDLKSEMFLALDNIATSDKPRGKKISNMFATSRFIKTPPFYSLKCSENGTVFTPDLCGVEELSTAEYSVDEEEMFYIALRDRNIISSYEYAVMELYAKPEWDVFAIAEEFWTDIKEIKNIIARVRKRIKVMELTKETFI